MRRLLEIGYSIQWDEWKRGQLMELNEITGQCVDAAMKVHTRLGPGLLESSYEACLADE